MKLDIKPYSEEWIELKKKCISSTEAGIINGSNKFSGNSPSKLLKLKLGVIEADEVNDKMKLGMEMEEDARRVFEKENGVEAKEAVYVSDEYEWMMTTIDGDVNEDIYLEIKCGEGAYKKAQLGEVPSYYYDQIQHSLFVMNKKTCIYMCFQMGLDPIYVEVERNDKHIADLIEKEIKFYDKWQSIIEAEDEWENDFQEIIKNKALIDSLTEENENLKKNLFKKFNNKSILFRKLNYMVSFVDNQYLTDWTKVLKKYNIEEKDLSDCLKYKNSFYKINKI